MDGIRKRASCRSYGVRRIDVDKPHEHLSVLNYKKQERTREVEELTEQAQVLQKSNDSMRESLEDLKDELSELSEDKDNIHLEMSKYVGEEWDLPDPPPLMSAKTYRTKIAQPLITKLKDVIRKLSTHLLQAAFVKKVLNVCNNIFREHIARIILSDIVHINHNALALIGSLIISRIASSPSAPSSASLRIRTVCE